MKNGIVFAAVLATSAFGCKKKGDINSLCDEAFSHYEKDDGKWTPGPGDKKAFMDYCAQQKPEVLNCWDMRKQMEDEDCKKLTGPGEDGFKVLMKLRELQRTPASSSEKPASVDKAATEKPADTKPSGGDAKKCSDYGATGEGTFEKMCELPGSGTFDVVATDEFVEDFGRKVRAVKVTNKMDRDVDLMTYEVFYYDKDGKNLGKPATTSGSGGKAVPAGKTVTLPLGREKTDEPAGVSKVEGEILAWTVGEGKAQLYFKGYSKKLNSELDDRPMGGWPTTPAK
jgi:hypothetical protein